MLQQSRDIQDRELSRLKAEALTLAARTAAVAAGGGSVQGSPAAARVQGAPGSSRASSSGSGGGVGLLQRDLATAQADRQQLQSQLTRMAAESSSSGMSSVG